MIILLLLLSSLWSKSPFIYLIRHYILKKKFLYTCKLYKPFEFIILIKAIYIIKHFYLCSLKKLYYYIFIVLSCTSCKSKTLINLFQKNIILILIQIKLIEYYTHWFGFIRQQKPKSMMAKFDHR